jgi:DNA polymerase III subunit epsilon
MIREIVLDTETTGLSPRDGHRVVEIGAIELLNHVPSGSTFHVYLNPQRDMPKEAEAVHGLSAKFLMDKPFFASIAQDFVTFVKDAVLIIHNAPFDMAFLNWELQTAGFSPIDMGQVVDTLAMAKQKFPMASNSLDALCKRFGIDLSRRTKHGALLDSELLADVYLELTGGRQAALGLAAPTTRKAQFTVGTPNPSRQRPALLPSRLTDAERQAHAQLVEALGEKSLWPR